MSHDDTCFYKARENDERTFTLRAQDKSSPQVIAYWILANIETAPAEKLHDALDDAMQMRAWANRKNAD